MSSGAHIWPVDAITTDKTSKKNKNEQTFFPMIFKMIFEKNPILLSFEKSQKNVFVHDKNDGTDKKIDFGLCTRRSPLL